MLSSPADWVRAGNAVETADAFAAEHGGNPPVLVFVDPGGAFDNDTECVNCSRGNAADHLTKDVTPHMISNFGVSSDPSRWGIVGWSMGGTRAVDQTVMHPDLFSAFVDIEGDLTPNTGTKAQTIASLFGGDADAWAAFDPTTVISRHGRYAGVSGWFAITSGGSPTPSHDVTTVDSAAMALAGRGAAADPANQAAAANSLSALGRENGIDCAGRPPRKARLADRRDGLHNRVAVAGRPAGHPGRAPDSVAGHAGCARAAAPRGGGGARPALAGVPNGTLAWHSTPNVTPA